MNIHWILAGVVIAFALTSVAGEKFITPPAHRLPSHPDLCCRSRKFVLAPANIRPLGGFSPTLESITIAVTCAAIVWDHADVRTAHDPQVPGAPAQEVLAIRAHPDDLELAAGGHPGSACRLGPRN